MLQTAYQFTKKPIYKETAFDLMENNGYLEKLVRTMDEIGKAPDGAADWSQMLSGAWNHSDRKSVVKGKSVYVSVGVGGRSTMQNKIKSQTKITNKKIHI